MKTLISLLSATIAAALLVLTAHGTDTAKGGGEKLTKLTTPAKPATVLAATSPSHACPMCKATTYKQLKATAKGGMTAVETLTVHGCPDCGAKVTVTGHGKAKTDKIVHSCSRCEPKPACCPVKK